MSIKLEDRIGKALLFLFFSYSALKDAVILVAIFRSSGFVALLSLPVLSRLLSFAFVGLVVFLTFRRLPAKESAQGIEPRVSALVGTFAIIAMNYVPAAASDASLQALALGLMLIGTALSVVCIATLGRSFSVMATARRLVTSGPYSIVRHPLYAAEQIAVAGLILVHFSIPAIAIGAVHFAFQIRRMINEERILAGTFPEYRDYAANVPMLVPRLSALIPLLRAGA